MLIEVLGLVVSNEVGLQLTVTGFLVNLTRLVLPIY